MTDQVIHLGQFEDTTVATATSTSASYTPTGPSSQYLVYCSADTCLARNRDATVEDVLVLAGAYARVLLLSSDKLHFIINTGGSDSEIRITQVSK